LATILPYPKLFQSELDRNNNKTKKPHKHLLTRKLDFKNLKKAIKKTGKKKKKPPNMGFEIPKNTTY